VFVYSVPGCLGYGESSLNEEVPGSVVNSSCASNYEILAQLQCLQQTTISHMADSCMGLHCAGGTGTTLS